MENGAFKPATELINNEHWMKHVLQPYVQNWSSECTPADSIAILKAKAIIDHVNDLWFGTNEVGECPFSICTLGLDVNGGIQQWGIRDTG